LTLEEHVIDHFDRGSCEVLLPLVRMPDGYALMRNSDYYFYWLRADGARSASKLDEWAVYCGAQEDKAMMEHNK
jgi:hypothetical protein